MLSRLGVEAVDMAEVLTLPTTVGNSTITSKLDSLMEVVVVDSVVASVVAHHPHRTMPLGTSMSLSRLVTLMALVEVAVVDSVVAVAHLPLKITPPVIWTNLLRLVILMDSVEVVVVDSVVAEVDHLRLKITLLAISRIPLRLDVEVVDTVEVLTSATIVANSTMNSKLVSLMVVDEVVASAVDHPLLRITLLVNLMNLWKLVTLTDLVEDVVEDLAVAEAAHLLLRTTLLVT